MTYRERGLAIGLFFFAIMTALFFVGAPSPAEGQELRDKIGIPPAVEGGELTTTVELLPVDPDNCPGFKKCPDPEKCFAMVVMRNRGVNSTWDNGTYAMWNDTVSINIHFTYNFGAGSPDVFEIEVPMGLIAVPPVQSVEENTRATSLICLDEGVGS
jgi:hypothetical protein